MARIVMARIEDYVVWLLSFGSTVDLAADGNESNVIDAADFVFWRDHFDNSAVRVVPEPCGWILFVAGFASLFCGRRRRRS